MKTKTTQVSKVDLDMLRNTVLFTLTKHGMSGRKKIASDSFEVDASKDRVKASKVLFDCPEFKAIKNAMTEAKRWCFDRVAPGSELRRGFYIVKRTAPGAAGEEIDVVQLFEDRIASVNEQIRNELIPAFIKALPEVKRKARMSKSEGGLGSLYDPADYPSNEEIRHAFWLDHAWLNLSVPDELPADVNARECKKLKAAYDEAIREMRGALRASFKELVDDALERLKSKGRYADKQFREDGLNGLSNFIDAFNFRDVTGDTELNGFIERMKEIVQAVPDAKVIRSDESTRKDVVKTFNSIKRDIAGMIVDRPKRRIITDDDE